MELPTPQQVLAGMAEKVGEENVPRAMRLAADIDPAIVLDVAVASKMMINPDDSPFDEKTRALIYLAAALATHDDECIKLQTRSALNAGASAKELTAVVKIVSAAASSGVIGAATPTLEALAG